MRYDKNVPLLVGKRLEEFQVDEAPGERPFRELIGCLVWSSTQTRPDISNTVGAVASCCTEPTPVQQRAALRFFVRFETDELIKNYV